MKKPLSRLSIAFACALLCAAQSFAQTKVYRGSVGNSHIQMRLTLEGNNVSGTYFYDTVGENLKLTGRIDDLGRMELSEFAAKGKQPTGKFICKRSLDDPIDSECAWSKPDGTRESMLSLTEQHFAFTGGLQLTPKTISNRRTGVIVSYPQVTSSSPLSAAAQAFNHRILSMVQKAIGEFQPIDGRGAFDTNYNVLLGTNDLVSVEMTEYYDGGGAHPNTGFWALTYDLAGNKELKFEDLFKPKSDYNAAIAKYVTDDINRRAVEIEKDDARRENRQPNKQDEPLVSTEQLSEIADFGLTPKGVVVYFDFPHVMAYFDKNFVPYSIVKEYLKPNGPAARFQTN
jgi:hypothetical protein